MGSMRQFRKAVSTMSPLEMSFGIAYISFKRGDFDTVASQLAPYIEDPNNWKNHKNHPNRLFYKAAALYMAATNDSASTKFKRALFNSYISMPVEQFRKILSAKVKQVYPVEYSLTQSSLGQPPSARGGRDRQSVGSVCKRMGAHMRMAA